ncbi:MAG: MarR family winged helix-turn-helix transcriptional regulator [Pseudomonadota bacterium]
MKDTATSAAIDLDAFLPFQMAIVANRVFQRMVSDAGLQLPEWRIMMVLPRHQPCSSNDLSILTSMDAARVSRAQRRLEAIGLIDVVQDQEDRRRLVVTLTETGMDEAERLAMLARNAEETLMRDLGDEGEACLRRCVSVLFGRI